MASQHGFHQARAGSIAVVLMALAILACRTGNLGKPTPAATLISSTAQPNEADSWVSVYFTDPDGPDSRSLRGGADQFLADAVRQARVSVDIAVLRLDLWSLRDALIGAHRRGVSVRMVTDSEYLDEQEVQDLITAGIPVIGDRGEGLMHNKFAVIDRQEVWTGSMNMTVGDAYRNNNHLIRLRSALLAENYTSEFEEMFVSNWFGSGPAADTPHPVLTLDGTRLENYFSPDDDIAQRLVELVNSAQESIYFLAYSFTSDDLASAMLSRAQAGVEVAGVMDAEQVGSNAGTEYDRLVSAGLDIRLDGNPNSMHHKVLVIDRRIVVTGSYNFTIYAETRNDENILIIDNPHLAEIFLAEFDHLYAAAHND